MLARNSGNLENLVNRSQGLDGSFLSDLAHLPLLLAVLERTVEFLFRAGSVNSRNSAVEAKNRGTIVAGEIIR